MCYYSFLIKKAAVWKVLDFTDFIITRMQEYAVCPIREERASSDEGVWIKEQRTYS